MTNAWKKDYVSVSRNTRKQKRLVLSNLNKLEANFKSKYVSTRTDFSKFCELHPKWCVLAGSSGTHPVCVFTYHQNMKLLIAPLNATCQELFPLDVCDINNKECIDAQTALCQTHSFKIFCFILLEILMMMM